MIIGALLLSLATGQEKIWITFPKEISSLTLMFYSGIALTVIAAFFPLSRRAGKFIPARRAIEIVCSLGALLFPLFMLQSVVFRAAESFGIVTGTPFLVARTGFNIALSQSQPC